MPCYSPLTGYRSKIVNPSGKRGIEFNPKNGYRDLPVQVPCGQCIGCRLERSRQWATRCIHEASLHEENCFLTLTYDQDHIPENFGLNKSHFQKFMKRLRKKYNGKKIRYFHCGEYGEKTLRPHYHACIFNHDFADKQIFKTSADTNLYTSDVLSNLWPYGFSTLGNVTFESAAYVARYIMKKVTGDQSEEHYTRVDPETGEQYKILPEYTTMSRRPGIGKEWYEKYKTDIYPSDFIIVRGKKVQPPKFYDSMYEHIDQIKALRIKRAKQQAENNTPERLRVRETVKMSQISSLKRTLDED